MARLRTKPRSHPKPVRLRQSDGVTQRAVAYIRVSTHEQAREGVSLDAQESRLRAYATMAGLELIDLLREEGVSATKPLEFRAEGGEMLRLARRGDVSHIIALKLDRLFRNAVDALNRTQEWDRAGIALHLVDMGGQSLNTGSAMGRMILTMLAGFAEFERNLISERTITALAFKKSRHQAYSPTPLGFDRKGDRLTRNDAELQTIRQIREWRTAGRSLRWIADELNCRQVPTKRGGEWHPSTINYILRNDLYQESA